MDVVKKYILAESDFLGDTLYMDKIEWKHTSFSRQYKVG